jgi:hypothetical protein
MHTSSPVPTDTNTHVAYLFVLGRRNCQRVLFQRLRSYLFVLVFAHAQPLIPRGYEPCHVTNLDGSNIASSKESDQLQRAGSTLK